MTNTNRTTIALSVNAMAVKAAFTQKVGDQPIFEVLAQLADPAERVEYEFGLFPEQDARAVASMYYTWISHLISLMPYEDKALQDDPKEGSLEANDTGRPDENAEQREADISEAVHAISTLYCVARSLDDRAQKVLEEAGKKTADGSRVRVLTKGMKYRPMAKSPLSVLHQMKVDAAPFNNLRRMAQIELAMELNFWEASPEDEGRVAAAFNEAEDLMDPERLVIGSQRAAQAVVDSLLDIYYPLARHETAMAELNAELAEAQALRNPQDRRMAHNSVMSRIAVENRMHRQDISSPLWLLGIRLMPLALLKHTCGNNAINELVDSPEWRAALAHERAQAAKAKASEVQSQMLEMEAMMAEQEANMQLLKLRQQQMAMQKAMAEQQAEFEAMFAPKKPKVKAEKPEAEPKPKAEKPKEEPAKPDTKTLNSGLRHLSNFAGAASSFRPRG